MTRKEFLQTVTGAAAAAVAISSSTVDVACAPSKSKLTRGVTFYSYKTVYYTRQMSLEELISEASSIGAYAIEMLPDDYPEYPNVSADFVKQWHGWMEKYRTVPDSYCQHQDTFPVEKLLWDIDQAKRLGFRCIRLMLSTSPDIVEKALPAAEKAKVELLYEVHGPTRIDGPEVQRLVQLMEKMKSQYLGINPDFSLWEKKPVAVRRDVQIRCGALNAKIAKYIDQACADGVSRQTAEAEVPRMGGGEREKRYLGSRYEGYQDPKKLLPLRPYVRRFHGKFYEMTEDYKETSIPYEELIPFLLQNGFQGVIASEYEGQSSIMDAFPVDEVEQVRRHHVMLRRLLGEV